MNYKSNNHLHGNPTFQIGEHNSNCKLNEDDVRTIRKEYDEGKKSLSKIASDYKVARQTIHKIVKRWTWKHVE